jgi:hypothetical protein
MLAQGPLVAEALSVCELLHRGSSLPTFFYSVAFLMRLSGSHGPALLPWALPVVQMGLEVHRSSSDFLYVAMGCLWTLSRHDANRPALLATLPAVRAARAAHLGHAVAQVQVMGLLGSLSSGADSPVKHALMEDVPYVHDMLQRHGGDVDVARRGMELLSHLARNEGNMVPLVGEVALVEPLLRRHISVEHVVVEGAAFISYLAYHGDNQVTPALVRSYAVQACVGCLCCAPCALLPLVVAGAPCLLGCRNGGCTGGAPVLHERGQGGVRVHREPGSQPRQSGLGRAVGGGPSGTLQGGLPGAWWGRCRRRAVRCLHG